MSSAALRSVTFVTVSEVLGGGELFTLRLAAALRGAGIDAGLAGDPASPALAEAARRGLRTEHLAIGRKLGRRSAVPNLVVAPLAARRLHRFLESRGPGDWVVLQYSWEKLLWGGRRVTAPVAVLEHGPLPRPLLALAPTRARLRRALRHAARLFAVSDPAATAALGLSGREPTMLRAGVERERAQAAAARREEVRARLGVGSGPLLAYAGRLAANKGVFELLDAARRDDRVHLVLLGEGPARAELEARGRGLGARLQLPGHVADPLPQLAAADAVALLSADPGEGRPLLALESLAVGTPVIGSARSAALRALREELGQRLLLVDPGDAIAVDTAIAAAAALPRQPVQLPSWDDVAAALLAELG